MSIEVGKITYENRYVKWNIKNFREVWRKDEWHQSPDISYLNKKCCILLKRHFKKIALFLRTATLFSQNLRLDFRLRAISITSDVSRTHWNQGTPEKVVCIDFENFLSKITEMPLHDDLTVFLRVFEFHGTVLIPDKWKKVKRPASARWVEIEDASNQNKIKSKKVKLPASETSSGIEGKYGDSLDSKTHKKLLKDFKGLLDSGENSDVKLVVSGKEFLAHRLILCTRSPVFKAMLCHDTSERDSGTVDIDDCDPDTFQDFLDYVYTGSTKHVNTENVINLYATSNKYLMSELKDECVSFMKATLSVEKFCGIATVALLYAEEELLEFSKNFFFRNSKHIIDSKNWDTFFKDYPKEAYEHFMKPLISKR